MSTDGRPARIRAPRVGRTPTLSIVIASRDDREVLELCLASLLPPCVRSGAEVIVVRAGSATEVAALVRGSAGVRFIHAPHDATVRQLRGIGMSEATGDIVALGDERSGANLEWISMLLRHAGADAQLDGAGELTVDWEAYFDERRLFVGLRSSRAS
jgi:hypothetical protein